MKKIINACLAVILIIALAGLDEKKIKANDKGEVQTNVEKITDKWSDVLPDETVFKTADTDHTITVTSPEQLIACTKEEFATTYHNFEGMTIYLGNDIDLGGRLWDASIENFKGVFDGQNYVIRNFLSNGTALFDTLGETGQDGGVVKNFTITGDYYCNIHAKDYFGGDFGIIANKLKSQTTLNDMYRASGIRNRVNMVIEVDKKDFQCSLNTTCNLSAYSIGGMFGLIDNANITNCYQYGSMQVSFLESAVHATDFEDEFMYSMRIGGVAGSLDGDDGIITHTVEKILNYGNVDVYSEIPNSIINVGGVIGDTSEVMNDKVYRSGELFIQDCANFGHIKLWRGAAENEEIPTEELQEGTGSMFTVGGVIGSSGYKRTESICEKTNVNVLIDRVSNNGQVNLIHNADLHNHSENGFIGGVMGLLEMGESESGQYIVKNSNNTGTISIQSDMKARSQEGFYIAGTSGSVNYLPRNMIFSGNFIGGVSSQDIKNGILLLNNFSTADFSSTMADSSYLQASSFVSLYVGDYDTSEDKINTNYAPDAIKDYESNSSGEYLSDENKLTNVPQYRLKNKEDNELNYADANIPTKAGEGVIGLLASDAMIKDMNAKEHSGETFEILTIDETISEVPVLTTIQKLRFASDKDGDVKQEEAESEGKERGQEKEIPVYLTTYDNEKYDVTLGWGAMDFKYVRTQESADEYGLSLGWNGNDKRNNRITIINNSQSLIYSNVSLNTLRGSMLKDYNLEAQLDTEIYEKPTDIVAVLDKGEKSGGSIVTAREQVLKEAATENVYLTLSGTPERNYDKQMIALLLVTISADKAEVSE